MRVLSTSLFAALLLGAIGMCGARADVVDASGERRLSIPSGGAVVLPKEDWVIDREQRRPGDTAVYYMMSSERRKMFFSVYIDRTSACQNSMTCLQAALKNPQYSSAQDLKTQPLGGFEVAQFHLDRPKGLPVVQTNVLASAYADGVWFDIHLSMTASEMPDPAVLIEFLKSIQIK
jgi:hypothetical protein